MKFTCEKSILQAAVLTCARAAAVKSSTPTLEGLLLEAGERLRITGFDLKRGVRSNCDATVDEPGSVVLNAKLFSEMVRLMPDGMVTIDSDGDNMTTVKCGKTEFSFMGMSSDDYPELPSVDGRKSYKIKQSVLKSMINETIFAVSDNESRPIYTGSLFEIVDGRLTIVSVDGYRLAIRREDVEGPEEKYSFVVPGTALSDVERTCASDGDDTAEIFVGSNHISFTVGGVFIVTRRLEGDFLDYNKAMPDTFKYRIKVSCQELIRAIDRVSLIIEEKTKNPIRLTFNDGFIDCQSSTAIGKAEDVSFCEGNGEGLSMGFNSKYMTDALKAAPESEVCLCLNNGTSPCIITPCDEKDNYKYMVLPVRMRS